MPDYSELAYREATDHLKQDVREFWSRSSFFIAVEGGLLSAYGLTKGNTALPSDFHAWLGAFSILTAYVWLWVSGWSVYWISRWLRIVQRIELWDPVLQVNTTVGQDIQKWSAVQGIVMILPPFAILGWTNILSDSDQILNLSVAAWSWWTLTAIGMVAILAFLQIGNFETVLDAWETRIKAAEQSDGRPPRTISS